jgi:hypothetical protein
MFSHEEFFNFVSTTSPIFLPSILYSIQLVLLAVLVYLNLRNSTILNFLQLKTPPKENRSPTEAPKFEDIPETQAEISQLEANSTKPNSETTQFKSCIPLIQFIFGTTTNHQDMADLLNDDVTRNIVSDYLVKLSFEGLISFRSVHGRKEIIIGNDGMRCGGLSNQPAEKTTAIQYARSIELVPALAERRHDLELQCADLPCLIGVGGYIRKSSPKTQDRSNFPMEVLNVHLHGTTETKLKTFRFHAYRWQCSPKIETQTIYNEVSDSRPSTPEWGAPLSSTPPRESSPPRFVSHKARVENENSEPTQLRNVTFNNSQRNYDSGYPSSSRGFGSSGGFGSGGFGQNSGGFGQNSSGNFGQNSSGGFGHRKGGFGSNNN